jgi:uncharacterized membrane protein YbaN (DUF454 family)
VVLQGVGVHFRRRKDMPKTLREWFLCTLGTFFVFIGIVGVIMPWLPHTPFFILATICYAKSSPLLHKKLLGNRFIGPSILQWQKNKSISRKTKVQAIMMMVISFIITVVITSKLIPLILLACLMVAISAYILSRPSE